MEVDDAACLVLGDLDEPDAQLRAQPPAGDAREAGQVPGQVGGEPAPQAGGVQVEQHGGFIVVAVRAHGAAEPGVSLGVADRAGDVPPVRADPLGGVTAGAARSSTVLPRILRACTGPNEGAVSVANTHG